MRLPLILQHCEMLRRHDSHVISSHVEVSQDFCCRSHG